VSWLDDLKKNLAESTLRLRAQGYENVTCTHCNGTGHSEEPWEDEYGRYKRANCRYCIFGSVRVKIDPARQKLAMKHLMRKL
jgi:hypothetical protein